MSYILSALADKPIGLWSLSSAPPYKDSSGYNAFGSVTSGAMSALVDTFAATLSTSVWPGTFGSVANTGGQCVIQTTAGYSGIVSAQAYDFTNSAVYISVVPTTQPGNGSREFFFEVIKDNNNRVSFFQSGSSSLNMRQTINGVITTTAVAYNGTSMLYLRLKGNATHFLWDTSPDGTTWTNQRTTTVVNNWNSVYASITSGYYGTETSPPATFVNSVNTTSSSGSPTSASVPTTAVGTVASAKYSQVFSSSMPASFDSLVYAQGNEAQPFSLEASFRVIDESGSTTDQKILSTVSNYDGITVNGTIVKFSTKYVTSGECAVTYDIQIKRNIHVVGVHGRDKNQLYVDGILVGETGITDAQKADTYITTDGRLYAGASTSAQKVAVNGIGIYASTLSDEIVKAHFTAARRTTLIDTVPATFGGIRFPMSMNASDVFVKQTWSTTEDWNQGTLNDVTLVNSQIVPQLTVGVSIAGNWQGTLPLDYGLTSVYGLSMTWEGHGVVVQASIDGSTWETAVPGKKLAIIPNAFNPTNQDLFIMVSFAGGITDDPSYIDNLSVIGFKTGIMPVHGGRTTTFADPASPMIDYQPIEQRDDWGVQLQTGSISISADTTTDSVDSYSMNIWLKKLTSTDPTFSITGATAYKNGTPGGTMNQGEWVMYTLTKATALTSPVTVSGNVQVGQIELFDHQLTAQEVSDLYTAETGVIKMLAADPNAVQITNPNPSTRIYSYTWAITSSG